MCGHISAGESGFRCNNLLLSMGTSTVASNEHPSAKC